MDDVWRANLIRRGTTDSYAMMVAALNRDQARVADGGLFLRFPSLATCREMDRCARLEAPQGCLDVERFRRIQAERDLGEGRQRLVLENDGGNPTNLSAYQHPDAAGEIERMRAKGLKGTGRGKGSKPSSSSAGMHSQESTSRSPYNFRNSDWSNYDRSAMRTSGSSGSDQPFNAFGNSRQSNFRGAGFDAWTDWQSPGWISRNERAQRGDDGNWENWDEMKDRW